MKFGNVFLATALSMALAPEIYSDYNPAARPGHAARWCADVIQTRLTDEETTLLLNLTYWSWQRSLSTIIFQKAAVDYLRQVETIFQRTLSSRLNPARMSAILNYRTDEWRHELARFERAQSLFLEELEKYRFITATYAQCAEYLVKDPYLSTSVTTLVTTLRETSRTALIKELQSKLTSINAVMEHMNKIMGSLRNDTRSIEDASRGFMDCIVQCTTPGMFYSFAKFDNHYNTFNEKAWQILTSSYGLSNVLWETTETARARFYAEHYLLLTQMLGCYTSRADLLMIAFNPEGFIEIHQRRELLPLC